MKKMIVFLISAIILFGMSLIGANAAPSPAFSLHSVGEEGNIIELRLEISNNPGLTALSVHINYSDNVELLSIEDAGLFCDKISTGKMTSNPAIISWYSSDCKDCQESGTLAILRFKVKSRSDDTMISLTYDPDNVFDSNFQNIQMNTDKAIFIKKQSSDQPLSYILGDVDTDGTVTIVDVTHIQRYLVGAATPYSETITLIGDADKDGELCITDATLLQRYLSGIKISYPVNCVVRI